MTHAPTPTAERVPARERPKRVPVNYAALRASLADSRAVFHAPRPEPKPRVRYVHAPMGPGLPCCYRRREDGPTLTLVSVRDGIATVRGADGAEWQEPYSALIGVRESG